MTPSRSVLRRQAAQRGEKMPVFVMTRGEMADAVANVRVLDDADAEATWAAAAELRKRCKGCHLWVPVNDVMEPTGCILAGRGYMPVDGSGFCQRWEAK